MKIFYMGLDREAFWKAMKEGKTMNVKKLVGVQISYEKLLNWLPRLVGTEWDGPDHIEWGEILAIIDNPLRETITLKMKHPGGHEVPECGEFPVHPIY